MKVKISISIDEEVLNQVEEQVKTKIFRNKSHFIEFATQKHLAEVKNE